MTTSNSLPPIAVDIVIFALAWFSDSEMNFSLVPGFSFSNSDDSFWASVICELDTRAIVTSFADAPKLPAPAHPAVSSRPAVAAHTDSLCSTPRILISLHPLLGIQKPTGTVDVAHQELCQPATQRTERGLMLGRPAGDQDGLRACPDVLQRHRHRALRKLGDDRGAVGVEEAAADLAHRAE